MFPHQSNCDFPCRSDIESDEEMSLASGFSSLGTFASQLHDCQTCSTHLADCQIYFECNNNNNTTHLSFHLQDSSREGAKFDTADGPTTISECVEYRPNEIFLQVASQSRETRRESPRYLLKEVEDTSCMARSCSHINEGLGLNFDRFVFDHMKPFLISSSNSQEALRQWDKQQGLPTSHARTTLNSGRTRRMLVELFSA